MKLKSIHNITVLGIAVLALSLSGISKAESDFSQIYFFGDSLSDPGNIFALTGFIAKAPYQPIPSAPYAIGGHQFSNGKTWAQRFAQKMKLSDGGKPALEAPGINGNYAFGGARARYSGDSPPAAAQIGLFLSDYYGGADPHALYVVQFGGNDLRDALDVMDEFGEPGFPAAIGILEAAVEATVTNIVQLYYSGARQFLVANVPNLARTPAVVGSGPGAVYLANLFGESYNYGLDLALTSLEGGLPGISITGLDFFGSVNAAADNPGNFGITFTDVPCLTFYDPSGAKCSKPGEYLFWDGIHPTAVIHRAIGDIATDLFNND